MNRLLALILLILMIPPFFIIAVLIKLGSKGPVLFRQKRVGLKEKDFVIFKFRTMYNGEYITTTGKWLRKFKLDELPQLINILKGEMNFVGPRPTLRSDASVVYWRKKLKVYQIKPGLTCSAPLSNLNSDDGEETAIYDAGYIKHKSFILDSKIILQTMIYVLKNKRY